MHRMDFAEAAQFDLENTIVTATEPSRLNQHSKLKMGQAEGNEDTVDLALVSVGDAPQEEANTIGRLLYTRHREKIGQ